MPPCCPPVWLLTGVMTVDPALDAHALQALPVDSAAGLGPDEAKCCRGRRDGSLGWVAGGGQVGGVLRPLGFGIIGRDCEVRLV